jgi:hypothetical protein
MDQFTCATCPGKPDGVVDQPTPLSRIAAEVAGRVEMIDILSALAQAPLLYRFLP